MKIIISYTVLVGDKKCKKREVVTPYDSAVEGVIDGLMNLLLDREALHNLLSGARQINKEAQND